MGEASREPLCGRKGGDVQVHLFQAIPNVSPRHNQQSSLSPARTLTFFFVLRIFYKKEYKSKDKHLYEHISELAPYMTPEFLEVKQDFINNDMLESSISGNKQSGIFIPNFVHLFVYRTEQHRYACNPI